MPELLRQVGRMFGMSCPAPIPPPPDSFTTPLSIDLWNVIAAPRLDLAAVNQVLLRHAPAVVANCRQSLAETSGAAHEADLYA